MTRDVEARKKFKLWKALFSSFFYPFFMISLRNWRWFWKTGVPMMLCRCVWHLAMSRGRETLETTGLVNSGRHDFDDFEDLIERYHIKRVSWWPCSCGEAGPIFQEKSIAKTFPLNPVMKIPVSTKFCVLGWSPRLGRPCRYSIMMYYATF